MFIAHSPPNDARGDKNQELLAFVRYAIAAEQPLQERNVPESGGLVRSVLLIAGVNPADDGRLPVVDQQRRDRSLRVDRRNRRRTRGPAEVGRRVLELD